MIYAERLHRVVVDVIREYAAIPRLSESLRDAASAAE
jgi:hypothetical protein